MKLGYFLQIFEKYPHINFITIPSSGSRDVPCRRKDGRTDDANSYFRNFSNAPKIEIVGIGLQFRTRVQSSLVAL